MKIVALLNELSAATLIGYRKKAVPDAMKKHARGQSVADGGQSEIAAVKRAKGIARSVRLQLKRRMEEGTQSASDSYTNRLTQCYELLNTIKQSLDTHAAEQKGNPDSWGFAGDLAEVASKLEEIAEFVGPDNRISESFGRSLMIRGKIVDPNSIQMGGDCEDGSDSCGDYIEYAEFTDGTPLNADDLDDLMANSPELMNNN